MTCQQIKDYIDKYSGLNIATKSREQHYIKYRSIYYFLCHRYAENGYCFNIMSKPVRVHRLTPRHGLNTFQSFVLSDPDFRLNYNIIKNYIKENTSKEIHDKLDSMEVINLEILKADLIRKRLKTEALEKYLELEAKLITKK